MELKDMALIFQILIPLGILNVWLVRAGSATRYRGGTAGSLKEEFTAYGLPAWAFYVIGTLKLTASLVIFLGIFFPACTVPGAATLVVLMLGALAMHVKVNDPLSKSVPAALMLLMSVYLVVA
jgi:uncharacterized membrane protein YphA (DoxX/SURF4 family)